MAGRDYRVTYKTQELDPREDARYETQRRQIPTALDPYAYPEDRDELKRAVAMTKARNARYRDHDELREHESPVRRDTLRDNIDVSNVRDGERTGAGTTKTTYSVTQAGLEKESQISSRAPTVAGRMSMSGPANPAPSVSRNTGYRERNDYDTARSSVRTSTRPYDDRDYSRTERVYDVERPNRAAGGYVVDMRDAEVIDIHTGNNAREPDRGFGGYRNDPRDNEYRSNYARGPPAKASDYRQSEVVYRDDPRTSASSLHGDVGGLYMSGARVDRAPARVASRSQTDFGNNNPSRATARYEDEFATTTAVQAPSRKPVRRDEEDYAIVEKTTTRDRAPPIKESFRDPFDEDPPSRQSNTPRGRVRASTYTTVKSPSDEYVMVSPPQDNATVVSAKQSVAPTAQGSLRSAIFREGSYTDEERQRRRRSRSISFRDQEIDGHYRGEKFCEKPGAEAAMMGRYLNHYGDDERRDRMDYEYDSKKSGRDTKYDERNKYEPQRTRSRSRKRRDDYDDDRSYVDVYREKTSKMTYY